MADTSSRPIFPKRAVITAGMPYGNKDLHFGHIGGVFVHADAFARFLRDRIGRENVIFVSGTDCYGSPIVEHFRLVQAAGEFRGDIRAFVRFNHERQKEVLDAYHMELDLFAASGFGRYGEIHGELCADFFTVLHRNGHLVKLTTPQFYDAKLGVFLNGRQVVGRCPIPGCSSEKAYADECSLGHPYEPKTLIDPRSTLTGGIPEMRDATNWYIDLPKFSRQLKAWAETLCDIPGARQLTSSAILEFLEPPTIYVKQDSEGLLEEAAGLLPKHVRKEGKSRAIPLVFEDLESRDKACAVLSSKGIRFRTGKALVPFRLTGNVEWGLPVPEIEGLINLTFWVWPESLWAPISFTAAYLESLGKPAPEWKRWWCSGESQVYQFIGEDNIYFYSLAEMAMFMGNQGAECSFRPGEGEIQLPELVANNHILFFDKKASSSGSVKPPMARDLLAFYTSDQLRAHFFALGLGLRSINFRPKPLNPDASSGDPDPVLKEGNLLSNVFNRAVRSCFYTAQKYFKNKIPVGDVSTEIKRDGDAAILAFEAAMFRKEFHAAMTVLDNYIRTINKFWTRNIKLEDHAAGAEANRRTLIDAFHMVRVATVLMHPIAPEGTEMIREYLGLGEEFWSWDRIFDTLYAFMEDPAAHELKVLPPRTDFFPKHPSQIQRDS
jgi:methionyl-tRNA synthetase